MEVVCIENVYGRVRGELWCGKGTLYSAVNKKGGIYIKSEEEKISYSHLIYSDDAEMKVFYAKHFLEIKHYVE